MRAYLRITFTDTGETLMVALKAGEAFYRGNAMHIGWIAEPTPEQRKRFMGDSEFAFEIMHSNRYEGGEVKGESPGQWGDGYAPAFRPHSWQYPDTEPTEADLLADLEGPSEPETCITVGCTRLDKSRWVKAAQLRKMKLVDWVVEVLNSRGGQ